MDLNIGMILPKCSTTMEYLPTFTINLGFFVGKYFQRCRACGVYIVVHRSLTFYLKIQLMASIQHQPSP